MSFRTHSGAPNGGAEKEKPSSSSSLSPRTDDKQKKLLQSGSGHFSMIKWEEMVIDRSNMAADPINRALHLADLITELNGFCGFMSIISSMKYCLGPSDNYGYVWAALGFMPFGLFFDFMDGKVARWRGKSSLMGQELDSLADLVSFGVSPAVCAFALGLRTPLDQLFLSFFVLCGLTRLARFNVTVANVPKDATGKSKYFEGTPIPTSLCIVGAMAYCVWTGRVEGSHPGVVGGVWVQGGVAELHPISLLFAAWGCAMVSRSIHIPKP